MLRQRADPSDAIGAGALAPEDEGPAGSRNGGWRGASKWGWQGMAESRLAQLVVLGNVLFRGAATCRATHRAGVFCALMRKREPLKSPVRNVRSLLMWWHLCNLALVHHLLCGGQHISGLRVGYRDRRKANSPWSSRHRFPPRVGIGISTCARACAFISKSISA